TAAQRLLSISRPKDKAPWPGVNFHIVHASSGTGESNVVPESATFKFNIRYGPSLDRSEIIRRCEAAIKSSSNYTLQWTEGVPPYFTGEDSFVDLVSCSIEKILGSKPLKAVDGGSSDGRFFSAIGIPTVEVGIPAVGLHDINESAKISDLEQLAIIYSEILKRFNAAYMEKEKGRA